jgi:polyribonucleotide 5'-hydroxyl-kinase
MNSTLNSWKEWQIPAGNEYRFEVPFDESQTFTFKLMEGTAEIFGSELAPGKEYSVSGCKLAIFTFTGARVAYQGGPCSVEYLSSDPAIAQEALLNLHVALEGNFKRTGKAARVLLLGSGRNMVARTLMNYAVRRIDDSGKFRPILVDLDVSNGTVCLPGTISSVAADRPLDVEESWHSQPQAQLITLFYGSTVFADNPKVYGRLCERMGEIVGKRAEKSSVIYVIAPNEVSNESTATNQSTQNLLTSLQKNFEIDHVLVIGNERLHVTVNKNFATQGEEVKVLKVPRAGGVVSKDLAFRRGSQAKSFKSYFYGPRNEFHPFSLTISMSNLTIYRVADATALAPSSALPLGATRKIDSSKLTKVTVNDLVPSQLLYSILAVVRIPTGMSNDSDEFEGALDSPVAEFLHVLEVDEGRQSLTVLAPCPGSLPSKFVLLSSLKWIEK